MGKVDKGFELFYSRLSYRRKFIRTMWMIPWEIAALIGLQLVGKNYVYTLIAGILCTGVLTVQALETYKKWMDERC